MIIDHSLQILYVLFNDFVLMKYIIDLLNYDLFYRGEIGEVGGIEG
jgi:hypothetical protein